MEYLTKDKLAEIVTSYYAKGVSYSEAMDYIKRLFMLSQEDCVWCQDVWHSCTNRGEIND